MSDELLAAAWQQVADNLFQIRKSRVWTKTAPTWDAYCRIRWSLSKTRAKLLCDFSLFCKLCREENVPLPDSPDNIAPILKQPRKNWLDIWEVVRSKCEEYVTSAQCQSVMQFYSLGGHDKPPPHVLKGQRVRKAASIMADMGDGEELVKEIGVQALGHDWGEMVRVTIEADQERMNEK